MDIRVFEQLRREELLSSEALNQIESGERNRPVSVHWDLRTLLYFGILLLSGGLGIILYKNIDTIGHATLVALTGLLAAACYVYCFKMAAPYSPQQVATPNVWFDYILLFGCLLMLTFTGYLQYQYHVFGTQWGLATFIPMLFLFYCSYYFDHKGVLSLAITNLGAWMGIAVAPLQLMHSHDLRNENIIINGVMLGGLLHLLCWLSGRYNVKAHFAVVYKNFGAHVLFISLLAGMFRFEEWYFLWFMVLAAVVVYHVMRALIRSSFYFLVVSVLYGYVGVSYVVIELLSKFLRFYESGAYAIILYFIFSGIGLVLLLMRFNKQLKGE